MKTKLTDQQQKELLAAARIAGQRTGESAFWDEVANRLDLYNKQPEVKLRPKKSD